MRRINASYADRQAHCERLIGSIRRGCLDYFIPLHALHLRRILREWVRHYRRRLQDLTGRVSRYGLEYGLDASVAGIFPVHERSLSRDSRMWLPLLVKRIV